MMAESCKSDLIHAILSMDSYNRGYGSGINGLDVSGTIGQFSLRAANPQEQLDWFNAGFYAIAYRNTATNEVVISYRGTDLNGKLPSLGDVSRASHIHHSSS